MEHFHVQPSELINLNEDDYIRYYTILSGFLKEKERAYNKDFKRKPPQQQHKAII